jgi:hypothetical protein
MQLKQNKLDEEEEEDRKEDIKKERKRKKAIYLVTPKTMGNTYTLTS